MLVLSISLANPAEVILAIVFVVVAFGAFIGTFALAIAYLYSNVFERWPDYTAKKRFQVVRNIVLTVAAVSVLIWLASQR